MQSKIPLILCDVLLLVNAINETSFYEDINISEGINNLANQDLEYAEPVENNMIDDTPNTKQDVESFNEDSEYSGPVDAGRRKGMNNSRNFFPLKLSPRPNLINPLKIMNQNDKTLQNYDKIMII